MFIVVRHIARFCYFNGLFSLSKHDIFKRRFFFSNSFFLGWGVGGGGAFIYFMICQAVIVGTIKFVKDFTRWSMQKLCSGRLVLILIIPPGISSIHYEYSAIPTLNLFSADKIHFHNNAGVLSFTQTV